MAVTAAESVEARDRFAGRLTIELLENSTPAEIAANMHMAGLEVDADPQINASRLASQMIEL